MPITAFWNIIVLAGGHNNNTLISKACNVNVHSISRCAAVCCHFYRAMLCTARTVLCKIAIFDQYLAVSKTIQDTAIVRLLRNQIANLTQAFEWYHFQ